MTIESLTSYFEMKLREEPIEKDSQWFAVARCAEKCGIIWQHRGVLFNHAAVCTTIVPSLEDSNVTASINTETTMTTEIK